MKMLKLLVLFSALVFTMMACPGSTDEPKTCEPACDAWKTCNTDTGKCELKDTYCENVDGVAVGCAEGQVCNSGYKCEDNACGTVDCDGFGTCALDAGNPVCTCSAGYDLSSDKKHCTVSAACSAVNKTGKCENACEVCNDGTCEPDGTGYLCEGGFNHRCNPANGDDDCATDTYCNEDPDDETIGYCSYIGCATDQECQDSNYSGRSDDKFICVKYGAQYQGMCFKVEDACTDIKRDAEDYGNCDTACGDADCEQADLCVGGTCAPECDINNDTCSDGHTCYNVNSEDFPLYRCMKTRVYCGDDADCTEAGSEACNAFSLGKTLEQDDITVYCGKPDGALEDGGTCNPDSDTATPEQSCKDGLCLASTGATEGTCSAVCDSYQSCTGDDRFCFAYSPFFSDTDAAMPVCVDNSIFTDLVYGGPCSQEGGCTGETRCTPQAVASVVTEDSDIDYLCFGSSQALTGAEFGATCTASENCKSGYCHIEGEATEGTCNAFCATDANCPDTHECKADIRYYTDQVDNDTKIQICVAKAVK